MGKRKDVVEKWHVSHLSFMTQIVENISDDIEDVKGALKSLYRNTVDC